MHKLCPFCHTWLSTSIFDEHLASHTRLLPDGQQQDHVTVRPSERFAGDIAKEPRWYVHPRCGGVTGMPEDIIRSYLADPFLYNESSFCTGCGTYVPTVELYWQETNESLQAASYRRKAEFIQRNHLNPDDFVWDASGPARRKKRGGGVGWGIAALAIGGVAALCLFGFVFLIGLLSVRAQAARNRQAAPPVPLNAGMPDFNRDFPQMEMPVMEMPDIPKGPDMNEIMRQHNQRMEEIRKQNDELLQKLRPDGFGQPGGIGRPPDFDPPNLGPAGFGPADPLSGIEDARQRAKEARERAQERMDAIRNRARSRP